MPKDTFLNQNAIKNPLALPDTFRLSLLTPHEEEVAKLRKLAYQNYIRNNITSIKYVKSDFAGEVEKIEAIHNDVPPKLFELENYDVGTANVDKSTRYVTKRTYWIKKEGSTLLTFAQNQISDNWTGGGTSSYSLLSVQSYTANYERGKLKWNNFIEWKLSFYNSPADTLHDYRIGDDQIRTYSDIGWKIGKSSWSYSSNLEVKTKLMKNYKSNSKDYIAALFSPLQVNMGVLGMKYQLNKTSKKNKYHKTNLAIDISPLSVQYVGVMDKQVLKQNRYGIKADEEYLLNLGSTLNAKLVINFNKQVTFSSRLKYFTDYKKQNLVESENELNMALNRYFSTRIFFYGRYDDLAKKDSDLGYFQYNELISFGFNYKW
jgi:hypothetical protein